MVRFSTCYTRVASKLCLVIGGGGRAMNSNTRVGGSSWHGEPLMWLMVKA